MSEVVNNALSLVNKSRQAEVESKAQRLIRGITEEQSTISVLRKERSSQQEALKALAQDEFTAESIFGTVPSGDSVNKATILKVIQDLNASNQNEVASQGADIVAGINRIDASIAAHEKNIANLRKELSELAVSEVTAEAVLG